ncbi:MAG: hypothetical protein ABRQ23_07870 [Syntrophomonadaceae bacterium]
MYDIASAEGQALFPGLDLTELDELRGALVSALVRASKHNQP